MFWLRDMHADLVEESIGVGDDEMPCLDEVTCEETVLRKNRLVAWIEAEVARGRATWDVVSKVSLSDD